MTTIFERFFDKVEVTDCCWNWVGGRTATGYGRFAVSTLRRDYSYRWLYEELGYPLPPSSQFVLSHLCKNRGCVNPEHLEVASWPEVIRRRGSTAHAGAGRKSCTLYCLRGHRKATANLYFSQGRVVGCKECNQERYANA